MKITKMNSKINQPNQKSMKKIVTFILTILLINSVFSQISGNLNYQAPVTYSDDNINVNKPSDADFYITIKGLANVKAESYVAIFSVSQQGETAEEVNKLMDERINQAFQLIKLKPEVETYIDMISFVPVYEFELANKKFNRKSYNEIPAGFQLKKNIHIKFSNPSLLNEFIAILASVEIYDLVRVDYFATNMETIKKELMVKAQTLLKEKLKTQEAILNLNFDTLTKRIVDGYKVVLPVEMYKSYQAYTNSSISPKTAATVTQATKSTTMYYQPILDKEFDFVINPIIFEPVIQVLYEIQMSVKYDVETKQVISNEYFIITPTGDVKKINVK